MKAAEDEFALPTTTAERKRELRPVIAQLRSETFTLKKFSFLIGTIDPFIVVPGAFARARDSVKVGDYALVVFGDAIYPALVGDIGPNDRVGEASLRIAKEINPAATPYSRPVSDLKVTYLVFPKTADTPFGPPALDKIQARCEKLVAEIGSASVPLHHWETIVPPSPTPTPTATPTPTPAMSPTPTPTPVASGASTSPPASPGQSPLPSATFAFPAVTPSATPSVTPSQ